MFSYVFMKILEARPRSYDRRMDKASSGRVRAIKEAVADEIAPASHVLEIGCGTGELAAMIVSAGGTVEGFDLSPSMISVARERIAAENLQEKMTVREMGVDGMDGLPSGTYDAVVATLVFSEFTDDERRFALKHSFRALKPGGLLAIADEVVPSTGARRFLQAVTRAPLLAVTYLISRASTRPLENLPAEAEAQGFTIEKEVRSHGDAFAIFVVRRFDEGATQ